MRYTAVGTGTIAISPERSCAGHLIESGDVRLLLDCGPGVVRRLAERDGAWRHVTHLSITHFHLDHVADIPTLIFASKYGMLPARAAPLEILGPPGTVELMQRLANAHGDWLTAPGFPLAIRELDHGGRTSLTDDIELASIAVPHTAESVAYSVTRGTRRIVYTGDTGVSDSLAAWATGCDLLVAECSLPEAMAIPEHLTPRQAGELAAAASARDLVLTHLYPPVEQVDIEAEVRRAYPGPLKVAYDGWTIEIEDD